MKNYISELKAFLYGSIIYLQIDKEVAKVLIILIFLDMILGTLKSVFLENLKFSLEIFWKGFLKKVLLILVVMVLALVARGLGFDDFKIMVTTVMKIMILNEGISAFNSVRSIYDKKEYKSNDFISILIEKISNYLIAYLDKLLKFFDNNTKCL